jgi:hypothetical protein
VGAPDSYPSRARAIAFGHDFGRVNAASSFWSASHPVGPD